MKNASIWTILGVVVAVIIAFFIVNVAFHLLAWIFKLVIVAIVAVVVFGILRSVFAKKG